MIDILLRHGACLPPEVTPPVFAIHRGDAGTLATLLDADPLLARQTFREMPYGNIALHGATLLHCAVEFGEIECAEKLLKQGADINARGEIIDGLGGQTPIYHGIASLLDGNFNMLEHLVKRFGRGIDMNVRATWRIFGEPQPDPMTPLEYAEKAVRERDPKGAHLNPRAQEELNLLRSLDAPL